MKKIILNSLFLFGFIGTFSAQTNWKTLPISEDMRSEFGASANEIDLSHEVITQMPEKEEVGIFLSSRITFERLFNDIGIKSVYGEDYPISQFFRDQYSDFMGFLNDGIRSGKITDENVIKDYYIRFVSSTKSRILNKEYDVNLVGSDKTPFSTPDPEKSLNGPCVNMDFEDGTTNGWELYDGVVDGTIPYSYASNVAVGPGTSHLIETGGTDPVCGFPMVNPDGGSYSLRLGDGTGTNSKAARLRQTFLVTAANSIFTYSYAMVLQSPVGHTASQQPYFAVRVYDQNGSDVNCGSYNVVAASGNEAAFTIINVGGDDIWYRNWTTVFAPLQAYIGQNVTIEFTTGDCSLSGHYGYAYVDASCGTSAIDASATAICNGTPVTLTAPAGAASYSWNTGATTQQITASTGGTYSVTMTPVSGSACNITLNIDITSSPLPTAIFSGTPTSICQGQTITFTDASTIVNPGTIQDWQWDFGDGISSPMGNGLMAGVTGTTGTYTVPTHTFNTPGNFNVILTVKTAAGCQSTISHPVVVTPGPTVNAGPDVTVCQGTAVTLTAGGTASINTWNNGVVNGSPFIQAPGSFNYIVTGANGSCIAKDTMNLTVITKPTPSISTASYCQGSSASIDAGAGYDSYLWSNGATTQTATFTTANNPISVTVTVSPSCSGTSQTINVTENPNIVHDSIVKICQGQSATIFGVSHSTAGTFSQLNTAVTGCDSTSNITLVINPLPVIDAGISRMICTGDTITLFGSGGVSYTWNNGITNGQVFNLSATTTYTVTGTDANGCTNTDNVTISADPIPVMNAGIDRAICLGDSTVLHATGATSFTWNNGQDGVFFTPGTTATYTVTGTSISGCKGSDQVVVTVNPLPNIKAKDTTVCEGQVVALYGIGGISYTWNNGVVNGVSFIPTLGATTYTVTGTDANGCVNTDNNVVTVNPFPDANVSASPISGYSPVITTFTNSSVGAGSYTWDFGDGQTASNNNLGGQEHAYSTIGEYVVILTANNLGCLDTAMVIITVLPYGPLEFNLPNVVTPNGDGSNDIFHLRLRNAFALNLQVFNRWGNLMKTITNIEDDKGWNGKTEGGTDADEGTYFYIYHITDMNGKMIDGHGFVQLIRK